MDHAPRLARTAAFIAAVLFLVVSIPFAAAALRSDTAPAPPEDVQNGAPESILVMDAGLGEVVEYTPDELERLQREGEARFGNDVILRLDGGEYKPIPNAPDLYCVETATDKVCGESREQVEAALSEVEAAQTGD